MRKSTAICYQKMFVTLATITQNMMAIITALGSGSGIFTSTDDWGLK